MKTSKKMMKCNGLARVWAAMAGCTGQGNRWHYEAHSVGRGRSVAVYCPACEGFRTYSDSLKPAEHQKFLLEMQAAAGVANYRYQRTRVVDGRPVLIRDGE